MTLYECVTYFKNIARKQPNVRSAWDGDIYGLLNSNPSIKYATFVISQTTHREQDNFSYYCFNLFYVDRLDETLEDNRLQVQSIGKEVISNIIKTFEELYDGEAVSIVYHPFTEKFPDLCAGQYATIEIEVLNDSICSEEY